MKYIPLAARIFLAAIFLQSGVEKFFGFSDTQQMMAEQGLPVAGLLLVVTIIFQLLGGLSLVLGYKSQIGAILLIIFLIPATLVFHNPVRDPSQITDFMKNLGLLGGLLMVIYFGSGPISLDSGSPPK